MPLTGPSSFTPGYNYGGGPAPNSPFPLKPMALDQQVNSNIPRWDGSEPTLANQTFPTSAPPNPLMTGIDPTQNDQIAPTTPLPSVPPELAQPLNPQIKMMTDALQGGSSVATSQAQPSTLQIDPTQRSPDSGLGADQLGLNVGQQQASLGNDGGILPQANMYGAMMQAPPMTPPPSSIY